MPEMRGILLLDNLCKEYRKKHNCTQIELSERIGMRHQQLSDIRNKQRNFSELWARRLGDFFKIDWKLFLE